MIRRKKRKQEPSIVEEKSLEQNMSFGRLGVFTTEQPNIEIKTPELGTGEFQGSYESPLSSASSVSVYYEVIERCSTPFQPAKAKMPEMIYPWASRQSLLTMLDAEMNMNRAVLLQSNKKTNL